jgi:hypothetical protein
MAHDREITMQLEDNPMRLIKIFVSLATVTILAAAVQADTAGNVSIRSVVGAVVIVRGGSPHRAKIRDYIQNGDLIRAADNSFLELDTGRGGIVTVRGPRAFRADLSQLRVRMDSGGALYSLYRNFSRNVQHRPPMTIVAAVRSREGVAEARKVRRDFEDALTFINSHKDDDAWRILSRITGSPYLTSVSKEQVKYYRAEILFREEKYAEALPVFDELSGSTIEGFPYREDSHARAILCAEHAGRYARMGELAREYLVRYTESGRYGDAVKELAGSEGK